MTSGIELTKNVIIICNLIVNTNSNNINKPDVNTKDIVSCTNMYNEPLYIKRRTEESEINEDTKKYINKEIQIN